jgi:hypothetical protein
MVIVSVGLPSHSSPGQFPEGLLNGLHHAKNMQEVRFIKKVFGTLARTDTV